MVWLYEVWKDVLFLDVYVYFCYDYLIVGVLDGSDIGFCGSGLKIFDEDVIYFLGWCGYGMVVSECFYWRVFKGIGFCGCFCGYCCWCWCGNYCEGDL